MSAKNSELELFASLLRIYKLPDVLITRLPNGQIIKVQYSHSNTIEELFKLYSEEPTSN